MTGVLDPRLPWPRAVERRACGREADEPYLIEVGGRTVSWRACLEEAHRWADVLGRNGVGRGDRVASLQSTGATAVVTWLACALLGAVEVPVSTSLVGSFLRHVVTDAEPALVLASAAHVGALHAAMGVEPGFPVLLVDAGPTDAAGPAGTPTGGPEPVAVEEYDLALIVYTSGTTGPSKGVMVPWGQLHESAIGSPLFAPDDVMCRFYCPFPMNHVSAKVPIVAAASRGGSVVLRDGFSLGQFWDDLACHGCTSTLLMASMASLLLQHTPDTLRSTPLRHVLVAPLVPAIRDLCDRYGLAVSTVFNMTELSAPISSAEHGIDDWRSCGRIREGWEHRIVDEHDRPVPVGSVGELVLRHREPWRTMQGYWGRAEATAQAWRNLWFRTGDLFSEDPHGNLFFRDRVKDSIRCRGENISSIELEDEIARHPDVAEVAAVGVPSDLGEEDIKIVVVRSSGTAVTGAELIDFVLPRVPRYMVPRYVEFVEALPRTPTHKVEKRTLRDQGVTAGTWEHRRERRAADSGDVGGGR